MSENKRKRLMTPDPAAPDATRRRLLTGGALTVAASAAALGRPAAADDPTAPEQPDRRKLEYRVTDHIAAYYARARG
jgi:hypothetical protein